MGKCEAASASIGIKILLSDLILQINENNVDLIREMLEDGFIDDENDYFNEVFWEIIHSDIDYNCIEYKDHLTTEFTHKGSYHKSRYGKVTPTIDNGCLLDKYLLVPLKLILRTERWGHERYGTNSSSRPLDFDLSVGTEKYKEIQNTEIVFILKQHSG
jgi:hypothetical protein